jgi:V/A-type H+-transporting ATPase subunit I
MFYPQEMVEVEIIVPEAAAVTVTRDLVDEGILHQVDASYLSSKAAGEPADGWSQKSSAYAELERRIVPLMQALGIAEGTPTAADSASMLDTEAAGSTVEQLEHELQDIIKKRDEEQKRLELLRSYVQQLDPIGQIDLDVSLLRAPCHIFSTLGTMPVQNVERLRTSLERIPFVLLTLRRDARQAVVWLLGRQADTDILERAARSAYLNPLDLPSTYQGTPAQIIHAVQEDIQQTQGRLAVEKGTIAELHALRQEQLQTLLWRVRASHLVTDAITRFGRLHYTYLIVGWVPAARLEGLTQRLKGLSGEVFVRANPFKRAEAGQNVPVALTNPRLLRGFQNLLTTYGWPRYQEIDPTVVIAVTFPLLFGAMFGDVGHGLVLALAGMLVASRKVRALAGAADLGLAVAICGFSAMVFGLLYGSIFGFEDVFPALLFHPLNNIMQILLLSVAAGIVVLIVGFLMSIVNAYVARDWGRLLLSHNGLAGLMLYLSLLALVGGAALPRFPVPKAVTAVLLIVSALAVMFSEPLGRLIDRERPLVQGGIGTYAVEAFFELFETLISLLSNSLSYIRVGAFAVAHGGLSGVVFILAKMMSPGQGLAYWIVVAAGNVFVIGFEGLIVGIQTLRLHYYEFFSKFFTGGGMRYTPLTTPRKASGQN